MEIVNSTLGTPSQLDRELCQLLQGKDISILQQIQKQWILRVKKSWI